MTHNKRNLKFYAKLIDKSGNIIKRRTTSRLLSFKSFLQNSTLKEDRIMYLKISYGIHEDVFGEKVEFINEGEYFTKKDLLYAFDCFYTA